MTINQITVVLIFILIGAIIGFIFDFFRILRKSFKTVDMVTYVQDFLFWICSGAILLYGIFKFNNGEIRGYIFVGIILGIVLYMLFLSKILITIFTKILIMIKNIISYPLRCIYNFIKKHIYTLIYNISKIMKKNIVKNKKKE